MIDWNLVAKIIDAIDRMNERCAESLAGAMRESRYAPTQAAPYARAYDRQRKCVVRLANRLAEVAASTARPV